MSYSIANANDDLEGLLHGTSTNDVTNPNSAHNRAARNLLAQIDPDETKRTSQVTIYDSIYDYSAPADLKEKRIVDFRPQVSRTPYDNPTQYLDEEFDKYKSYEDNLISVFDDTGTKRLKISKRLSPSRSLLDSITSLTSNGTWAATASAQNLAQDKIIYYSGGASLKLDLASAGSSGYIENTALTSVDLTDHDELSSLFLWVYLPSATAITSINLRWGSSSANYWNKTVTVPHFGSFVAGWNLVRFDWNGATETGTVNPAAITYARITFNYGGTAVSGIRVDELFSAIGKIYDLVYYSKYLFSDSGTWAEKMTDDNTVINLDTASYNLYLSELGLAVFAQLQDGADDYARIRKELYGADDTASKTGLYALYKSNNPSQTSQPRQTYYKRASIGRAFNGWGRRSGV